MISLAFVNGEQATLLASDNNLLLEKTIMESSEKINMAIASYKNKADQIIFESEILGEITENNKIYLEAEKSNIFKTVGDAVMSVYEKIKKLIMDFIQNIKNMGFKNKTDMEKLDVIMKEHPDLKEMAMEGWKSGDLKVSDANSIKELNKAFNELLALSKKKDVDPKSLKAKWEKAKEKFENADKNPVVTTAKGVSAVLTTAGAIILFKKYFVDAKKATADMNKMISEDNENFLKTVKALESFEGGKYGTNNPNLSSVEVTKNAYFYITKQAGKMITNENKKVSKISNFFDGIINKFSKKESIEEFKKNTDLGLKIIKSNETEQLKNKVKEAKSIKAAQLSEEEKFNKARNTEKARESERQKNRQDAADKAFGSEKGRMDYYGKNKKKVDNRSLQDSAQKAYGQNEGNTLYRKNNEDDIRLNTQNDAFTKAYGSEQGKNRFNKDYSKDVAANQRSRAANTARGKDEYNQKHPQKTNKTQGNNPKKHK